MTKVEVVVAAVIFLVLVAILATPVPRVVGRRRSPCKQNGKNIGLGLHNFVEEGGAAIPAEVCPPDCADFGAEIDVVEFAEYPERFSGPNRPWWYVDDPAELTVDGDVL